MNERKKKMGAKDEILIKMQKIIPETDMIESCKVLENCMKRRFRICCDIKKLCIICKGERYDTLGGISFLFDARNGIVIYRYNEADGYAKVIEGKGFDNLVEKYEKDEVLKEITERTKFKRDEERDAEDKAKIEAFKRQDVDILVTRKNSKGKYEPLDIELIKLAKEKEQKTGKPIKIVDQSDINRTIHILSGVDDNNIEKINNEIQTIMDADPALHLLLFETEKGKYLGIASTYDDILGNNDNKDKWVKYFSENYGLNLFEKFNKK